MKKIQFNNYFKGMKSSTPHCPTVITYSLKTFTLVEMLMTVFVLIILILIISQFYSYTVVSSNRANSQMEILENARIALDLMSTELMCLKKGKDEEYPFKRTDNSIAFISETPLIIDLDKPERDKAKLSDLYEVQYEFNSNTGKLERSITGNIKEDGVINENWDLYSNNTFSEYDAFNRVIPNVTYINFRPYYTASQLVHPATIEIELGLMSRNNWVKWSQITDNNEKIRFCADNEKKFVRLVQIDERL
ncbi:MAG: hypothetical protein GY756_05000 [bacterium]|nr:hypothetical protein [bacterium]